ncbi:MAG TPA: glycine/sarcosine/betaine reductase selenoprotein B family protein [Candidatus Dormibacteraeota bacterium]|nr:glycine/sarcosine/betaine reductase selenoprotein B family protein [Candidatus Dormibacteraeota bacterium]
MIVDSFRYLPRSFRPLYEGRGPYRGEEAPVWAPFVKRLADSRIALLTSAGLYVRGSQEPFDLDAERARPEWGDPSWRAIPADASADLGVAHLHINDEDLLADPEIVLPRGLLANLAEEGVIGSAASEHLAVMGYQERNLRDWHSTTAPAIASFLQAEGADGVVLAPA